MSVEEPPLGIDPVRGQVFIQAQIVFQVYHGPTTTLNKTITIPTTPPTIFPINASVDSIWDWKVYAASYTWSFLQTNKYEVGLDIGAYVADIALGIRTNPNGLVSEPEAVTAPLPVLGLTGAYAFTPKLVLRSDVGVFALEVGEVKGSQWNFNLDLEYNAWKYMGFGIGYNFYRLDVDVDDEDALFEAKYQYHGIKVFLKFYL